MGEPFAFKDMEATSDMARSIEQLVERTVTEINGNVFKFLRGEGKLKYTDEEWQRFCSSFMCDDDVILDFNKIIILATKKGINLNEYPYFVDKFAKHFRPQHEKKKRQFAQIIQLAGMGNLRPPKREARKMIQRVNLGN